MRASFCVRSSPAVLTSRVQRSTRAGLLPAVALVTAACSSTVAGGGLTGGSATFGNGGNPQKCKRGPGNAIVFQGD